MSTAPTNTKQHATIATGHPEVSAVAKHLLDEGGNAFDAVVGAGFMSALAEPALTSLGGGGFCLTHQAHGDTKIFDFFCDTPGLKGQHSGEPHFEEVAIHFPGAVQHFHIGRASIAVPGMIKGLLHLHKKLGKLPLDVVLAPAIAGYREGLVMNAYQARLLSLLEPILRLTKESEAFYAPRGHLLKEGEVTKSPQTAELLERLVHEGAAAFYEGPLAEVMPADCLAGQGFLTREDLRAYDVVIREPHRVAFRGHQVLTNPAPSLGGSLIALGLHLYKNADLSSCSFQDSSHVRALLGVMVEVDALRKRGILCKEDLKNPLEAAARALPAHVFSRGTTHMSIADKDGNMASMTTSNGEGSGVMVPGTGIMLNNMMGEDDLHPEGFHSCPAGVRVSSMMSPTLLLDEEGTPKMLLGSGGSKRIRTAILQVLTHVVDFNKELNEAVDAPRLHWDGEVAQLEPGFDDDAKAALAKMQSCNEWQDRDVYFGGVHALIPGKEAAGDPRRGGHALRLDVPS
ncbi:MAG: gamma-glutamyltransferase [Deltaproteobacteria bacterium]|nr:gamma-glutamyltransferase [Deltaproteobacteria bacterium]